MDWVKIVYFFGIIAFYQFVQQLGTFKQHSTTSPGSPSHQTIHRQFQMRIGGFHHFGSNQTSKSQIKHLITLGRRPVKTLDSIFLLSQNVSFQSPARLMHTYTHYIQKSKSILIYYNYSIGKPLRWFQAQQRSQRQSQCRIVRAVYDQQKDQFLGNKIYFSRISISFLHFYYSRTYFQCFIYSISLYESKYAQKNISKKLLLLLVAHCLQTAGLLTSQESIQAIQTHSAISPISMSREYEVESIEDCRLSQGQWEYLIKWKFYPKTQCTWEPECNLGNCKQLIRKYKLAHSPTRGQNAARLPCRIAHPGPKEPLFISKKSPRPEMVSRNEIPEPDYDQIQDASGQQKSQEPEMEWDESFRVLEMGKDPQGNMFYRVMEKGVTEILNRQKIIKRNIKELLDFYHDKLDFQFMK